MNDLGNLREILMEEYTNKELDPIIRMCKGINKDLASQWDMVIHIGGMDEGMGKSSLAQLIGIMGDPNGYNIEQNNIYLPDYETIREQVYGLQKGSYINYDEAVKAFSKLDRFKNWQSDLIKLFTLCRKQYKVHMFCMPNIMDYNKMFRTRRIRYWIEITRRGHAVVIKRDSLPGNVDPWHIDSWVKWVFKSRGRRGYAKEQPQDLEEHLRRHPGYIWEFNFPKLPDKIYKVYEKIALDVQRIEEENEKLEDEKETEKSERIGMMIETLHKNHHWCKEDLVKLTGYGLRNIDKIFKKRGIQVVC